MSGRVASQVGQTAQRTALVMLLDDPATDPRPKRMIQLLKNMGFGIDVLSRPSHKKMSGINAHFVVQQTYLSRALRTIVAKLISPLLWHDVTRDQILCWRWNLNEVFRAIVGQNIRYDLIVVEDIRLLPLGSRIQGRGGALLFDAREYYPRQYEDDIVWRMLERPERLRLCRTFLSKCDKIITVAEGIAKEYFREFGVQPVVIKSAPEFVEAEVRKTDARRIRMVHHGIANPNRRLEYMLEVATELDERFEFDLYLTGSPRHIEKLARIAARSPRVRILPAVPFENIHDTLSQYDIGFYYLEPRGFNVTYNLPNKLFEFIQARLAVAIGPSPEMARIVQDYGCGIVAKEFSISAMTTALNSLDSQKIDELKSGSAVAARELNFATESKRLQALIADLCMKSVFGAAVSHQ